ncbi:MAG: pyridoxamine 5'-phosphate oxidase [Alphaproteobacteria bacterium]|jgi:pyridoxamine 5'-phosphate oxidase|nr:pyridoxamine 5'-phosphate oxidase [Alphaproteobacteria bacterium]
MTIPEYDDPIELLRAWLDEAEGSEAINPNAMAVTSVSSEGRPSIRTVLLKDVDDGGCLVFYTNLESHKGRELLSQPVAAACFYWRPLARQISVEGSVSLVDDAEADDYFASRPRESQIGAWASEQSRVLESRESLERAVETVATRYEGQEVPRPPHWSGFRLDPKRIEFWQSQPARLHYRLLYDREADGWSRRWLYP